MLKLDSSLTLAHIYGGKIHAAAIPILFMTAWIDSTRRSTKVTKAYSRSRQNAAGKSIRVCSDTSHYRNSMPTLLFGFKIRRHTMKAVKHSLCNGIVVFGDTLRQDFLRSCYGATDTTIKHTKAFPRDVVPYRHLLSEDFRQFGFRLLEGRQCTSPYLPISLPQSRFELFRGGISDGL